MGNVANEVAIIVFLEVRIVVLLKDNIGEPVWFSVK